MPQYPQAISAERAASWYGIIIDGYLPEPDPPVNRDPPVITGATTLGATLTCTVGNWYNVPSSYTYAWRRNGTNIGGATTNTHVIVAADQGTELTVLVTASNAYGSTPITSVPLDIPPAGP
jgi:hypothetical protein